jgi:succinate dehydrogenase hydrophobic anchor subunit
MTDDEWRGFVNGHHMPADRFERVAMRVSAVFIAVMVLAAIYGLLAIYGAVPAMPWSPAGQAR